MARLVHTMIRVLDEARSVDFYKKAFDLDVVHRIDFDDFSLLYLRNQESHFELELTVNKGRTEPYELGNGYGHLAVVVDDLDALHQRFTELGFEVGKLVDFDRAGERIARFFFATDPDGYKIEVIQSGGRFV